ncbi:trimeric intracellular cation channel family protein [Pontibacter sp. G13]|uniref:trimeric intracellular cation channel family protein n=1 Tax=Pontibacter sp. G13 TaxID=3074898 RepID=UPI00288A5872|nr:trimeric intracellular cation channel family protein [Pontibacter sp. G13]WNJ17267.1 trimeric intracellular cation channel family protein [Pontibacter sp. G13]
MELFDTLDVLGTAVFAISGALTAKSKRLDLFGILIVAFFTAVGGGTIRSILVGTQPIAWMVDLRYMWAILVGYLLAVLFGKWIAPWRRAWFLFDTIGLGVFTILGLKEGIRLGYAPIIAMLLGMVTASFGGIVRDILTNTIPLILRKEVYALASLAGGAIFLLLENWEISELFRSMITLAVVMIIRFVAVKYHLGLPVPASSQDSPSN